MSFHTTNRKLHKWISIAIALPVLLLIVTGGLLLVKKEFSFIQPPTIKGQFTTPTIAFEDILRAAQSVPQANIKHWSDVARLDVRPGKGVIKIRSESEYEIQIDATTGLVLHHAMRRSDFIESLHDGTYFQSSANLWLMLPVAVLLLFISITGLILFVRPYLRKWSKQR